MNELSVLCYAVVVCSSRFHFFFAIAFLRCLRDQVARVVGVEGGQISVESKTFDEEEEVPQP